MIIKDEEALKRLASPLNLINQLRNAGNSHKKNNAMSLFVPPKIEPQPQITNPSEKKEVMTSADISVASVNVGVTHLTENTSLILDNILENSESQIKLGLAHDKALDLLTSSVNLLAAKLNDVKADKLPSVVVAASKVVEGIRKERSEANKNNKEREVHYHFYTPQQRKLSDYEIIDVGATSEAGVS